MLKIFRAIVLLLTVLALTANSQKSAPMKLSYNKKYFNSAVFNIQLDGVTSATVWDPMNFTISYPFAFSDRVAGIFLSITNILTDYTTKDISFHAQVGSFNQTSMKLQIYCNFNSNFIKMLNYRYTAYTSKYLDDNNWRWLAINKKIGTRVSESLDI